jgi:hypothetical protein
MAVKNQDGIECNFFTKKSMGTPSIRKLLILFLMQNVDYWLKEYFQPFMLWSKIHDGVKTQNGAEIRKNLNFADKWPKTNEFYKLLVSIRNH